MEKMCELFENFLPNNVLDDLILKATNEQTLNTLLQIKQHRLGNGTCEKLSFPIKSVYYTTDTDVLEKIFSVTSNTNPLLVQVAEYARKHLSENPFRSFNLLNFIAEYSKDTEFWDIYAAEINSGVLNVLENPSEPLFTFTELVFLPKYFSVCSPEKKTLLLEKIFDFAKKNKNPDILCVLYNHFQSFDSNEFWEFLAHCITTPGQLQKQGAFLLSKMVEDTEPWRNYFILLDAVNEKNLHLIQPSLHLFDSVKTLPQIWRIALYKNFLNHSQNAVVYAVAVFILQNEKNWQDFTKICKDLLCAVNKHEYSVPSVKFYKNFEVFIGGLNREQFEFILGESVGVTWTPVALWCFCDCMFSSNHHLSFNLLEKILRNVKEAPHVYIRRGCMKLILNYFAANVDFTEVECLKFMVLLREFDEGLLSDFLKTNKEKLERFKNYFNTRIKLCMLEGNNNLKELNILMTVVDPMDYGNYVFERIQSADEIKEFSSFMCTPQLINESFKILLEKSDKYTPVKKKLAFEIIARGATQDLFEVYSLWKDTFLKFDKLTDDHITVNFVKILFKIIQCDKKIIDEETLYIILNNILDSDSKAKIIIFENVSNFNINAELFDKVLAEFLNLHKTKDFEPVAYQFLSGIFKTKSQKLVKFLGELWGIAKNNSAVACVLSESVVNSSFGNLGNPSLIVDLILFGTAINHNETVKYSVCQCIQDRVQLVEESPNLFDIRTRLSALDAMMHLIHNDQNALTNEFVNLFLEKYQTNFHKRYFPNSEIHLQKLRTIQALLLIQPYITNKKPLIETIIDDFLSENHQPSVKHLLQWLLICLLKNEDYSIQLIAAKLKTMDKSRNSTVLNFIPILYHVATFQTGKCNQVVDALLPWTMGPQLKLRLFSQVALLKLFKKTTEGSKYKHLEASLQQVVDLTVPTLPYDINNEFFDYFSVENCDFATIYYTIPKTTGVSIAEWQNLGAVCTRLKNLNILKIPIDRFCHHLPIAEHPQCTKYNIQKKITPWKDILNNTNPPNLKDFILVTSFISKPTNLGGLCRTCEVFGIKAIAMRTSKITTDKDFKSLSLSSENWVDIIEVKVDDFPNFLLKLKSENFQVIGAEQTAESVKLDRFEFQQKTCLVLGNEKEGLPPDLIPLMDKCVEIPQFGVVRSLNVHVAGAIVMWEYCKQHKL